MVDYVIETDTGIYRITREGDVYSQSKLKIPIVGMGMEFTGTFKEVLKEERKLKTRINNRGYLTVCFMRTTHMVHRLVAKGFCTNPLNKPYVNHIDGNKTNNLASNLEWCTCEENLKHARDTGLWVKESGYQVTYKSEESKRASLANLLDKTVLTDSDVMWARRNYIPRHKEFGVSAMARKFGVTPTAMSNAVRGKSFSRLK